MIPLSEPNITGNASEYVQDCLDTGWVGYVGDYIDKLENNIKSFTKVKHAIACMNGTSALQLAIKACGVAPAHEVLVPTLTFVATITAIKYNGAEPVFMDCDRYLNLDPEKLEDFCRHECDMTRAGLINKRTNRLVKAIMPVHVFGSMCDMRSIMEVADRYGLIVIEDAAEALGAAYNGYSAGTIGKAGMYSFSANKLTTAGSGGILVTNDDMVAEKALYYASMAKDDPVKYIHNDIGHNFRMSNVHAAIGLSQMEMIQDFIAIKNKNFFLYHELLGDVNGITLLNHMPYPQTNYWFYGILVDEDKYGMDRDALMQKLDLMGIQTRPIWKLNHTQIPYSACQSYKIEKAEYFWRRGLNIPCSTTLTEEQIHYICSTIAEVK